MLVGHQPGLHRARDADARLDGRAARPARPVPLRRARAAASSRARRPRPPCAPSSRRGERATRGRGEPARQPRGDLVAYATAQAHSVDREGRAHRRHRQRQPARSSPHDDGVRHAPRRARAPPSPRTAPPDVVPFFVVRHRRHHVVDWPSTPSRSSPTSAGERASGSTSTRPWPASPRCAPSCAGSTPGSTRSTRTAPTRTSGWASTSTATCSGWPTGPRCSVRCRSCPSTCGPRPARPAPSSTTATGRSRSAAASGPSSSGSRCAATASAPIQAMIRRPRGLDAGARRVGRRRRPVRDRGSATRSTSSASPTATATRRPTP